MRERAVIVAGGEISDRILQKVIRDKDWLIAADAGVIPLRKIGRYPDYVIGDLDTVGDRYLTEWEEQGVQVEVLPVEKNVTDTHAALQEVIQHKPKDIVMIGMLGGDRQDHALANLGLLEWLYDHGYPAATIYDDKARIRFLCGPGEVLLDEEEYHYVTIIPVSHQVKGVTTVGMRYPLYQETLFRGYTRSVSNEMAGSFGKIRIEQGRCFIVEVHPDAS